MDKQRAKDLLGLIAAGDKEALKDLYREFGASLKAAAYRVLSDKPLSEDVLNEVIFDVYQKAGMLSGLSNPLGYIYTMAFHRAVDLKRKRRETTPGDAVLDVASCRPDAAGGNTDEIIFINSILEKLVEPDRRIFILKTSFGYSFYEIAGAVGLTYKQVRRLYLKAEARFKEEYKKGSAESL